MEYMSAYSILYGIAKEKKEKEERKKKKKKKKETGGRRKEMSSICYGISFLTYILLNSICATAYYTLYTAFCYRLSATMPANIQCACIST